MISRVLILLVLCACPALQAGEPINTAYLAIGIKKANELSGYLKSEIATVEKELEAIRTNAIKDPSAEKTKFRRPEDSSMQFVFRDSKDKKQFEEERLSKIKNLKRRMAATWIQPWLLEDDLNIGSVGFLGYPVVQSEATDDLIRITNDRQNRVNALLNPQAAFAKVLTVQGDNFAGYIVSSQAPLLFFADFRRSDAAVDKSIEIKEMVVVLPASNSANGKLLTVRKLTAEEISEADKYVSDNKPKEVNPFFREWTDVAGKFTISAELVDATEGKVVLKKSDGSTITIPLSKLSRKDREWIKNNY